MKYLHKFTSMADFQAAYDGQDYIEPWVSLTLSGVPTKISCSDEYENVYTLEYQGQALVGGETNCHIWYDSSNERYYATETRTIEDETEISYLYITEGDEYEWDDGSFSAEAVEVLESEEGINYVHYNKKPVYDFIIDYSSGDAWNGLKITYINPSFGPYEEVETSTDPPFYGYMMENISSIILKQTLSVQILNSEGPTEIVVPFYETNGTDYYSWIVSESGWNMYIYLEYDNNDFDEEGWVLRIMHFSEG